jgi:hypothetical protein
MRPAPRRTSPPPPLVPGERLKQPEFHRRYEQLPDDVKFELVGGVVYMASPMRRPHSLDFDELYFPLALYRRATPGVELLHDATNILGDEGEPQPDLGLRILTECGGQSWVDDANYVNGASELVAEVAHSTRALDLGPKRQDYEAAGVCEYIVLCVEERELHWFDFAGGGIIAPNRQGVYRSRVFPGLWLHGTALLDRNSARVEAVARQGLASRAHAAFVRKLERARRRSSS